MQFAQTHLEVFYCSSIQHYAKLGKWGPGHRVVKSIPAPNRNGTPKAANRVVVSNISNHMGYGFQSLKTTPYPLATRTLCKKGKTLTFVCFKM